MRGSIRRAAADAGTGYYLGASLGSRFAINDWTTSAMARICVRTHVSLGTVYKF